MVADKSSMLAGVEVRVPLATPEIFNFNLFLKTKLFINFFNQNYLLNILKLSSQLFNRPKQGFNPEFRYFNNKIGKHRLLGAFKSRNFQNRIL